MTTESHYAGFFAKHPEKLFRYVAWAHKCKYAIPENHITQLAALVGLTPVTNDAWEDEHALLPQPFVLPQGYLNIGEIIAVAKQRYSDGNVRWW